MCYHNTSEYSLPAAHAVSFKLDIKQELQHAGGTNTRMIRGRSNRNSNQTLVKIDVTLLVCDWRVYLHGYNEVVIDCNAACTLWHTDHKHKRVSLPGSPHTQSQKQAAKTHTQHTQKHADLNGDAYLRTEIFTQRGATRTHTYTLAHKQHAKWCTHKHHRLSNEMHTETQTHS